MFNIGLGGGNHNGGFGSGNSGSTNPPAGITPPKPQSQYGIGNYTGNDREAELTYRDLYQAQWKDFKDRFLPYQEKLMDAATSTKMLDEQLSRITALSSNSKKLSTEAANIARGRMGLQQTQQQQQSFNSNLNMDAALGVANAQNNARSAAYDRYQGAMTGSGVRPQETVGSTGGATS